MTSLALTFPIPSPVYCILSSTTRYELSAIGFEFSASQPYTPNDSMHSIDPSNLMNPALLLPFRIS
jgi:hypothetical protein